jgi:metal-responsive CopG/Arc/MetJ family transcriptional regulator
MATRKMTFTLPADLADQFVRKVAPRSRSRYLAQALAQKLQERDQQLIRACEVANRDPEVQAIEKEFDAISEEFHEPWTDAKARRRVVDSPRPNPRVRD